MTRRQHESTHFERLSLSPHCLPQASYVEVSMSQLEPASPGSIHELQAAWREAAGFKPGSSKSQTAGDKALNRSLPQEEITFKTVAAAAIRANRSRKTSPTSKKRNIDGTDDTDDDVLPTTPFPVLAREAAAEFARHGKTLVSPSPPHRNPSSRGGLDGQRNSALQARVHEVGDPHKPRSSLVVWGTQHTCWRSSVPFSGPGGSLPVNLKPVLEQSPLSGLFRCQLGAPVAVLPIPVFPYTSPWMMTLHCMP